MHATLSNLWDIRPGEGRPLALGAAATFCLGAGLLLLYAASRAVFLSHYPSSDLPYVYVGVALGTVAMWLLFTLFERRLSPEALAAGTLALLVVSLAGLRLWLARDPSGWPPLVLAVWFDVAYILSGLAFWGLANSVFDLAQAKRLFGLMGAGEFLAVCLAGLATPALARILGAADLLWLAVGWLGAALACTAALGRAGRSLRPAREKERTPAAGRPGPQFGVAFSDRYVTGIHLLWAVGIAGLFLTDLILNAQAQAHAPNAEHMAGFFGWFYALAAAVVLLLRAVAAGRIITGLGSINSLVLLPGALVLACMGVAASTSWASSASPLVFWLAVSLKLLDYVIRSSFYRPAFMVLYQPLAAGRRLAAQASVEGLAEPVAVLAVAGLLLALSRGSLLVLDAVSITYLLMGVLVIWLLCIAGVRRGYNRTLLAALGARRLTNGDGQAQDRQSLALIARGLASDKPGEALSAMDILARHDPDALRPALAGLLAHPSPEVVREALVRIEALRPADALPAVRGILRRPPDPAVAALALKAYGALAESEALEGLLVFLDDPDRTVARGAMVALLRHGGIEGVLAAGGRLMALQASPDEADREAAALVLGEIGQSGYYRPLAPLLDDASPRVRAAALAAAERLGNPRLAFRVIAGLGRRDTAALAVRALAAMGPEALPEIVSAFADPGLDRPARIGLVRAAARLAGDAARDFLLGLAEHPDAGLRREALEALEDRAHQAAGKDGREWVLGRLAAEAKSATWLAAGQAAAGAREETELLARALGDELGEARARMLALLAFLSPPGAVAQARTRLRHPARDQRAIAVELLESLTPPEARRFVLPLLRGLSPEKLHAALAQLFPLKIPSPAGLVSGVLRRDDGAVGAWTRTAALYAAGLLAEPALGAAVREADLPGDPAFAETRQFALARMRSAPPAPPVPFDAPDGPA
ncbi:MAG: HEAT repeat domain-containing protein [Thermodesulfobacteriota bacterium]